MSNLSKGCAIALSLSFMSFASGSIMAAECGQGDHWVDKCPAGTDKAPSKAEGLVVEMPCGTPKYGPLTFRGPTVVEREAGDPDTHTIQTEMVYLNLKGKIPGMGKMGEITIRAGIDNGVATPTLGQITELVSDPRLADSYFDVFFEVDLPDGSIWHSKDACHMKAVIDRVPPLINKMTANREPYSCADELLLYDEAGLEVACLIHPEHFLSVKLDSFTATAGNGEVEVALEWATGTEKDNAGFVVWRGQPVNGQCSNDPNNYTDVQPITSLVASQGTEVSGATYTMADSNVVSGTIYCYALEDRDFGGKSTYHLDDIVSATP